MTTTEIGLQISLKAEHQLYLSQLAILHYGKIEEQNEDMIRKFIQLAPWAAWPALTWRHPEDPSQQGIITVTINLTHDTVDVMKYTIDQINLINRRTLQAVQITPRIFVATAIYWWIHHVYPTPSIHYS